MPENFNQEERDLLSRLDERTKSIYDNVEGVRADIKTQNMEINTKISGVERNLENKINTLEQHMENNYVSKETFSPVKMVVYGLVGLLLAAVFTALFSSLIPKQPG